MSTDKKEVKINCKVSKQTYEQLRTAADRYDCPVSHLVRLAIQQLLSTVKEESAKFAGWRRT